MAYSEQAVIDSYVQVRGQRAGESVLDERGLAERAARGTLRAQLAKLERELSAIVAEAFPHIAAPAGIKPNGRGMTPSITSGVSEAKAFAS